MGIEKKKKKEKETIFIHKVKLAFALSQLVFCYFKFEKKTQS